MTTDTFPTRIIDINYTHVLMLPFDLAHDWIDENFVDGKGWVGIQGDRAYITDEPRPVRLGPNYPGQVVTPLPEALEAQADVFLIAEAQVGEDCWALTTRIPADTDPAEARVKLGFRVMAAVQKTLAVRCSTGCGRDAFHAGPVAGQRVELCRTCTADLRDRGTDLSGLMPLLAFTEDGI